jgi:hypothetical protein
VLSGIPLKPLSRLKGTAVIIALEFDSKMFSSYPNLDAVKNLLFDFMFELFIEPSL